MKFSNVYIYTNIHLYNYKIDNYEIMKFIFLENTQKIKCEKYKNGNL